MTLSEDRDDRLHREALLLGTYLVGRAPEPELVGRYVTANRIHMPGPDPDRDRALLAFVLRRPWSVGALDAAAGLLAPRSLLRRKALLMTAILEATPDHVDRFLPRPSSAVGFLSRGAWIGIRAGVKALVGLVLWPLATASSGARGSADPGGPGGPSGPGGRGDERAGA